MRRIEARRRNASPLRFKHSQSFASLLHLPNHAKVRSTTHRLGNQGLVTFPARAHPTPHRAPRMFSSRITSQTGTTSTAPAMM